MRQFASKSSRKGPAKQDQSAFNSGARRSTGSSPNVHDRADSNQQEFGLPAEEEALEHKSEFGARLDQQSNLKQSLEASPRVVQQSALKDAATQGTTNSNSAVIQRLVGFEFETNWQLSRAEKDKDNAAEQPPELKRDDVIIDEAQAFKLAAEEVPGKEYTVAELKTHAVSETDRDSFDSVFDRFMEFGAKLEGLEGKTPLKDIANMKVGYEDVEITPKKPLTAQPQVTGGIRLDRIAHFLQATDPADKLSARKYVQETGEAALSLQSEKAEKPKTEQKNSYSGLVALLAQYVIAASRAGKDVAYPKGAIPILSRMSIPDLISAIEKEYGLKIEAEQLIADVMNVVGTVDETAANPYASFVEEYKALWLSLNKDVEKAEWEKSTNKLFDKFKDTMDIELWQGLRGKTLSRYGQRFSANPKTNQKALDNSLKGLEAPMFSSESRTENLKIPSLTSGQWLKELKDHDLITWGFEVLPKNQAGRAFGIETVGEEEKPGVPLEVRSLGAVEYHEWRELAQYLFDVVARINAPDEPVAPDRKAREFEGEDLLKVKAQNKEAPASVMSKQKPSVFSQDPSAASKIDLRKSY
ncbi:hypothetical protein [uncultured Roseovarius sp.]|uniref:hypothetical protein n=1 Tax=uncultured Roseovarius sp. TaxID=293344 RepID=UPI00260C4E72|nr:hypothetical protein [uncultured Roseovarius sp.]